MLPDFVSLENIVSLVIGVISGFGMCKITSKSNEQKNGSKAFINIGDTKQENNSSQ